VSALLATIRLYKQLSLLLLVISFPVGATATAPASWPTFLHNLEHHTSLASSLTPPLKLLREFNTVDLTYALPGPYKDCVIVGTKEDMLTSFNSTNGKQRQSQDLRAPISATPAATQGSITFVTNAYGEQRQTAIDIKSGQPVGHETLLDNGFQSSSALVDNHLYIGTMNGYLMMAWGKRQ